MCGDRNLKHPVNEIHLKNCVQLKFSENLVNLSCLEELERSVPVDGRIRRNCCKNGNVSHRAITSL